MQPVLTLGAEAPPRFFPTALEPRTLLAQEARALLTRLAKVKPFSLLMPSVPAAALLPRAQSAIEVHMHKRREELRRQVHAFLAWLAGPESAALPPAEAQRRLTFLRLRFNATLSQFDIFANVLSQRSEHGTGTWLGGLDIVAGDALALPDYYEPPPVVCYLDRGHGAAIRRARTRLPGGESSPIAIIRVPRERMVGSGIASSLIHEVGHQGAELLSLVKSLRPVLQALQKNAGPQRLAWQLWERWINEIVADLWSVAQVGIVSTMGLMGVVSLPRVFVFHVDAEDPHPMPYLRVKLSCAMGHAIFPHPQWGRLSGVWESFYPLAEVREHTRRFLSLMEGTIPGFVGVLVNHRLPSLRGKSLPQALNVEKRQPAVLGQLFRAWRRNAMLMRSARPHLVFAVLGQARANGWIGPEQESAILSEALTSWALGAALETSAFCALQSVAQTPRRSLRPPGIP